MSDELRAAMVRPALTKIIATVGPASSTREVLQRMIEAGVSVIRLNFGHGTLQDHTARVRVIREISRELGRPVAIMGDLQGPKIRVGQVAPGGIEVQPGDAVVFQRTTILATPGMTPLRFNCTYDRLVDDVEPGQRLLVNDGAVRMLIVAKHAEQIECAITPGGGGLITTGKGINLPDTRITAPSITDQDWAHVDWAIEQDLDFLALSFVRSADDVKSLRDGLMKREKRTRKRPEGDDELRRFEHRHGTGSRMQIIAKIEVPAAVSNIDGILDAADAIMVARGDLGVEMDLARVPVIQKMLIQRSDDWGKPCIVATQMLESMISAPAPTRAEVSDVANAIFDGADAVMLSGETAVGKYPALAVENMRRIAESTELHLASLPQMPSPPQKLIESKYGTAALAHGAWTISQDIGAKFIAVWSQQGGGARYLSQNRFCIPIIAITSDDRAARQMQLLRSVVPLRMTVPESLDHFTRMVDAYLLETGWTIEGDPCLLMAGVPIGVSGSTNRLAIHRVGEPQSGFCEGR